MPDLQTSDRHKTSEPPPKHWNNFADDFENQTRKEQTNICKRTKITLPTKTQGTKP